MPKNLIATLEPGDVVLFYDKIVKDDKTIPGNKVAVLRSKLFIYQGNTPQGGLLFANAEETRGMSLEIFSSSNCILLPKDQAPAVVREGFDYVFAI